MNATRTEEINAAAISLTLAVAGIITNGAAVGVIIRMRHLHNAFGYSCMSHAIGGLGVLLIFVTWVPLQLLITPEAMPSFLQWERLAYIIGQITILFYYGAIYTHVLIGLNRYIATTKPFSYTKYFNERKTMQWIALLWIIAFLQSCAYQFDGCHYYFNRKMLLFMYSDALCGVIISNYFEFYGNLVFVIFVVLLDILTYLKLRKIIKVVGGANTPPVEATISWSFRRGFQGDLSPREDTTQPCQAPLRWGVQIRFMRPLLNNICEFEEHELSQKGDSAHVTNGRKAREIRFFVQSVCSETVLILCFLCFWCIAVYATTPFSMFLTNSVPWQTLHLVDGIEILSRSA